MKNVLIIGAGGIASYFFEFLEDMISKEQIPINLYTIADFDLVETKNIKYQNFGVNDVGKNKANVLVKRSKFKSMFEAIDKRINSEDLSAYDGFIICADNGRIRKEIYEHWKVNKYKFFIDLRSEGRTMAFFTSNMQEDKLDETLNNLKLDEEGSCQLTHELENNIIQFGNRIIASIGIQLFLNYFRDEKDMLPSKVMVI